MFDVQGKTVREIALESPLTTRVFEEYKIDYCCHGDRQFDEACRSAGAQPGAVTNKINDVLNSSNGIEGESLSDLSLSDLVDHILDKNHVYTREEITYGLGRGD